MKPIPSLRDSDAPFAPEGYAQATFTKRRGRPRAERSRPRTRPEESAALPQPLGVPASKRALAGRTRTRVEAVGSTQGQTSEPKKAGLAFR